MKKIFLTMLTLASLAFSPALAQEFTNQQIENLKIAYVIGKATKANDGSTFEKTLSAMMLVESDAGEDLVGDDRYKNGNKKPISKSSLGPMQMKISTVREISRGEKSLSWLSTLNDDQLVKHIINSPKFACVLAAFYVRNNYNHALKKRMFNPHFRTVSRYNGGWNNTKYYNRFKEKRLEIDRLKKEGILK